MSEDIVKVIIENIYIHLDISDERKDWNEIRETEIEMDIETGKI